jgi:hypothetical protein
VISVSGASPEPPRQIRAIVGVRPAGAAWLVPLAVACADPSAAPTATSTDGSSGAQTTGASGSGGDTTVAGAVGTSGEPTDTGVAAPLCNGAPICERRVDQVVFAATHNAFAATDDGFVALAANQTHGVAQQLDDGIRALLLDVTMDGDQTALCHGDCLYGSTPHVDTLLVLDGFLAAHPSDVIVIIYQDDVSPEVVEADYVATGLDSRVFTHAAGDAWPTLGELVDAGTTLLVTAEFGGPPPAWYHHVWDLTWDTPYEFQQVDDFDCSLNRGAAGNDLMLINHWLSTPLGLPSAEQAAVANAPETLRARVEQCRAEAGRLPTFFAVDFYEVGGLVALVDELNAETITETGA